MKNAQKILIAFFAILGMLAVGISFVGRPCEKVDENGESKVFRWTGNASDDKWSSSENWDLGMVPAKDSAVVFDSSSGKASIIDKNFPGEIVSLRIEGYGAKIVQENNLIISGDYYQDSGAYDVRADLEVAGDFIQKEGSLFSVWFGETKVGGKFEISDGFKYEPEATVYIKNFGDWKTFIQGERGGEVYYAVKLDDSKGGMETWEFINPTNSFRSYISQEKGWTLTSFDKSWSWRYLFGGIERSGKKILESKNLGISSQGAKVSIQRAADVEEWYENSLLGIEQGFTISEKPAGEGSLVLSGEVVMENLSVKEASKNTIRLAKKDNVVFEYSHLSVLDAEGKELSAELEFSEIKNGKYGLKIIVDDSSAKYPIIIDPLSSVPDWMGYAPSSQQNGYYGKSVYNNGDINGDGYYDVLVGAYNYTYGQTGEGALFVYYGSEYGLSTRPSILESNQAYAYLGYSVTMGDFNGDGYADIAGGAHKYDGGEEDEGAVFVYYGSESGLSTTPWIGESNQAFAYYGRTVTNAGDVNGNGCDDLAVGAYYYDNGENNEGAVFIYYGQKVSGLPDSPNLILESNQEGALFGFGVAGAGDVNKDGFDDVIVGAYGFDNGTLNTNEGRAFLYRGSSSGISSEPDHSFVYNKSYSYFGNSVAGAGDVNGDGWPDVIIGAYGYDGNFSNQGAIFVYYGSDIGFSTTPSWQFMGEPEEGAYLGWGVAGAGDINNDGIDDIIVGAPFVDGAYTDEGKIYVFYGSVVGLPPSPSWSAMGGGTNAYLGFSVSGGGDINKDQIPDIIAGGYGYDIDPLDGGKGGKAILYHGFDGGPAACTDINDPACDYYVDKQNVVVTVSTDEQDNFYDDVCNVDTNSDGIKDTRDVNCSEKLNFYQVCDIVSSDYSTIAAQNGTQSLRDIRDTPCDRDTIHDDYYYSDTTNPMRVQPSERQFSIRVDASDQFGIESIKIEWINKSTIDKYGDDWSSSNVSSYTCSGENTSSCIICVNGGGCENDVIKHETLGIPEGADEQSIYFRAIITDNNGNTVTTGYDDDKSRNPVLDKFHRFHICGTDCATCTNRPPEVATVRYEEPSNFCDQLDYRLFWSFSDPDGDSQAYYEVQVREKDNPSAPVMSAVRQSSNADCRLFAGFLDGGNIECGKTYEWRVRVYDNSTEERCQAVSLFTPWTSLDMTKTFTTPVHSYPKPSFTLKDAEGDDCTVSGNCGYLKDIIMDGTASQIFSSPGGAVYHRWYVDDMSSVYKTEDPSSVQFMESSGAAHSFRLEVEDSSGYKCSLDKTINLQKPHAQWNEVAPMR